MGRVHDSFYRWLPPLPSLSFSKKSSFVFVDLSSAPLWEMPCASSNPKLNSLLVPLFWCSIKSQERRTEGVRHKSLDGQPPTMPGGSQRGVSIKSLRPLLNASALPDLIILLGFHQKFTIMLVNIHSMYLYLWEFTPMQTVI